MRDILGDDEAVPTAGVDILGPAKKPLRGAQPRKDILDEGYEEPTWTGAAATGFVQGFRQQVGGMMEALGDSLNPKAAPLPEVSAPDGTVGGYFNHLRSGVKQMEAFQTENYKSVKRNVLSDETQEFGATLAGAGAELGDDAREKAAAARPEDLNILQDAGLSIAQSTGRMLPWLVAARGAPRLGVAPARENVVRVGALGDFGTMSFGQTYNEAKAHGATPETALEAGIISGAAEILGEGMALNTLLSRGPGWFKNYLVQEIGGEEYTTITQALAEKSLFNADKWSSPDEIAYDLAVTALAAAGGAGTVKVVDSGLDYFLGKKQERAWEGESAERELAKIEERARAALAGIQLGEDTGPVITPEMLAPLTPEERVRAVLQKEQLAEGLPVEPSPEGVAYGAGLRGLLEAHGLGHSPVEAPLPDEGGMTEVVNARRERTRERNLLPFDQRPISASTDGNVIGLTLQQVGEVAPGFVGAIGQNEQLFPGEVIQPIVESLKIWVDKYMPDAKMLLNLEQLSDGKFGAHTSWINPATGEITHIITPRELPSFHADQQGNVKSKAEMMGGLVHEFGHALKVQNFVQGLRAAGLSAGELQAVQGMVKQGGLSQEILAGVKERAPVEGALLEEWQRQRAGVLDGTLTAQDFVDQWVGLRKLGDSVMPGRGAKTKSLYSWAERMLGKRLEGATALELVEAAYGDPETALNFDEFMAEQYSRAANSTGDLAASPLGRLFAPTLERLRNLFRDLKSWKGENGERIVAPGTTFQDWLDAQTARAESMEKSDGTTPLSKKVKAAQKKLLQKHGLTPTGKKSRAKKVVENAPPPPEIAKVQVDEKTQLSDMAYQLESAGTISQAQLDRYLGMAERGQLVQLRASLERVLGEELNFDREYTSKVLARLPDKAKVKAETLRAYIKMADVKAQEREMWERFLKTHPNGFTLQQAKWALEQEMMPLEPRIYTDPMEQDLEYGMDRVGFSTRDSIPTAIVWEAPIQVDGWNHFDNLNYVAHTRRVDRGANRFVLEIQSDLMQRREAPQGMENQGLWDAVSDATSELHYMEAILEEIQETKKDGAWSTDLLSFKNLIGATSLEFVERRAVENHALWKKKKAELDKAVAEDRDNVWWDTKKLVKMKNDWWVRVIREEVSQANKDGRGRLYFPSADTLAKVEGWGKKADGSYGEMQGIYDRYRRDIAKFLKREYGAVEEEVNGEAWFAFDPAGYGETVLAFDQENPYGGRSPEIVLAEFAGLTPEEYREPARVAEAAGFWERLGFDSPYFKRWGGNTKVLDLDGKPLEVYRGAGTRTSFLDPTTRGGMTGAGTARKAFWFSANKANAQWYANHAQQSKYRPLAENFKRAGQKLRRQIAEAEELREGMTRFGKDWGVITNRLVRLRKELGALEGDKDKTVPAQAVVQGYYLNLVNPLVVDLGGQPYEERLYAGWVEKALAEGHDGLVLTNTYDPLGGTVYAVFAPEAAKASSNVGTFDPTDSLHWDAESPGQQAARTTSKLLQKFWPSAKLEAGNVYSKLVDTLIQLQQTAAAQPDDYNLQEFLRKGRMGQQLKNNLLKPAEDLVQKLSAIVGQSSERSTKLFDLLKAEWKSGELQTTLIGLDHTGAEVWGPEAGTGVEQQAMVSRWEVQDTLQLREWMAKQGVDVTTEEGKVLHGLYLENRNLFLAQFHEIGVTLKRQIAQKYATAPDLQKAELHKVYELVGKLITAPFAPQGNFGNYVLVVKRSMVDEETGKSRMKTIYKRHFERKADFDKAYAEAHRRTGTDLGLQVTSQVLADQTGIPMQLPSDMLEQLGMLGEFTDENLSVLADIMTVSKYDRIAERFEKISNQVDGGETNYVRVLADFAGRNANFIWKGRYRGEMQRSISASKHLVTRVEKDPGMPLEEKLAFVERTRRNIGLMQKSLDYVMNPPQEFQGMRSFITLVYLAFNVKTALMNLSTTINTWAAVTSEYGEVQGNKEMVKSWKQVTEILLHRSKRERELEAGRAAPTVEDQMMNELISVMDKAVADGVVDQSYAYFLAAQADSGALLSATKGRMSQVGHAIAELGMLPFQATEKLNRIHSLVTFYKLERGLQVEPGLAYRHAVQKTNLLQNAYDQLNRPELFRGKTAILTMFMSYAQFMGWMSLGGYERGARATARSQGRDVPAAWRGTTVKLWLVYLMLGGLMGVPFAQNLMDVVQWLWRKLGFGNAEVELRLFMEDLGMDANWAMHGLMHDLGGFNLSASFGLGRLLPGTDLLRKERDMNTAEVLGSLLTASSGPAGNFYKSLTDAIGHVSRDPLGKNAWLDAGKSMPGAIGAVSKATDAAIRQELAPTYGVTTKDGRRMTWDEDMQEFRDITTKELFGQALGFNPTILAENRAQNFAVQSELYYWQGRRSNLMDRYWQAIRSGDEELRERVLEAQGKFNETVPDRKLRISQKDRVASVKGHRKQVALGEKFGTESRKYRDLAKGVQGAYMRGGEED